MALRWISWSQLCFLLLAAGGISGQTTPTPHLSAPHIDVAHNTFYIHCSAYEFINFNGTLPVDELRYIFYADDQNVYNSSWLSLLNNPKFELPLSVLKNNINKRFRCAVKTRYRVPNGQYIENPEVRTHHAQKFGIWTIPESLVIEEGRTTSFQIISTIPIMCNSTQECCLSLNLELNGDKNNLAVITECRYEICLSHWNTQTHSAVISVPLMGSLDNLDDGDKQVYVKFRPLLPSGGGEIHHIFDAVKIPELPVTVKDVKPGVCTVTGDPHVQPFERQDKIHYFNVGDHVIYESQSNQFELHGRSWPCGRNSRASCLCGIVAREGDDVIEVSMCSPPITSSRGLFTSDHHNHSNLKRSRPHHDHLAHPPHDHHPPPPPPFDPWSIFNVPTDLLIRRPHFGINGGTRVHQNNQGNDVHIYFPSGATVDVHRRRQALALTLTVPPSHLTAGDGRGICGTYNNDSTDDLTDRNGKLHQCISQSHCMPNNFTKTWKLHKNQTLFLNPPQNVNKPSPTPSSRNMKYCECQASNASGNIGSSTLAPSLSNPNHATILCSGHADQPVKKTTCSGCFDVTDNIPPGLFGGNWVATRDAHETGDAIDFDVMDTFGIFDDVFDNELAGSVAWPTSNNVTEAQARQICQDAVKTSHIFPLCKNVGQLEQSTIDECVDDFLLADGDGIVNTSVTTFNMLCMEHLQRDPANFKPDPAHDGRLVLKDEMSNDICDQDCEEHGHCDKGTCVCDSPRWSGQACTIDTTTGVHLHRFVSSAVCDMAIKDCKKVTLFADNFEESRHLMCKAVEVNADQSPIGLPYFVKANYTAPHLFTCYIPLAERDGYKPHRYFQISAASDRTTFGNSLVLQVKDSRCEDTSLGWGCIINGICHWNGAHNTANQLKRCNTYLSSTSWSYISPKVIIKDDHNGQIRCVITDGGIRGIEVTKEVNMTLANGDVVKHETLVKRQVATFIRLEKLRHLNVEAHHTHIYCSFNLIVTRNENGRVHIVDSLVIQSPSLNIGPALRNLS